VARDEAEIVFVGAVRAKYDDPHTQLAGFEVGTVFKGHVPKWLVSYTSKAEAGSNWSFVEVGHSYLVFSKSDRAGLGECGTGDVAESATSAKLAALGSGHPPDPAFGVYFPHVPSSPKSARDSCTCDLSMTSGKTRYATLCASLVVLGLLVARRRARTVAPAGPVER
jgi:hypothetical protein